jgi:hypothetical protein
VKGRGSSRGGQSADDMQIVEGKRSCKRSSAHTDAQLVQIFYNGAPDLSLSSPSDDDRQLRGLEGCGGRSWRWYLR